MAGCRAPGDAKLPLLDLQQYVRSSIIFGLGSSSIRGLVRSRLVRWQNNFCPCLMGLHMALQAADLLLQTPSRALKCIVDRKINVGVTLVGIRLVANIHLFFIRQSEADMDLKRPPLR
jgi:hypothetical protein